MPFASGSYQPPCGSNVTPLLILLDNLFYGGRSVNENVIRLDKSPVSRQKEFVRFCNELLDKDGLCFGIEPEEDQINIFGKTSSALNVINL